LNNGWTKYFENGDSYVGSDELIAKRLASWTNSPSENLRVVDMDHDGCLITIHGEGEYWQSDRFRAVYPSDCPVLLGRTIQKRILDTDTVMYIHRMKDSLLTIYLGDEIPDDKDNLEKVHIHPKLIDHWLVLAIDLRGEQPKPHFFFSKERV